MTSAGPTETRSISAGSPDDIAGRMRQIIELRASMLNLHRTTRTLLDMFVEGMKASRASLILVNPRSGRPRIAAAVGLPPDAVGQDLPPARRRISDWVFRERRPLILTGEVRDNRFDGMENRGSVESAMSLPLVGPRGTLGVLNLARRGDETPFSEADVAEAEKLAGPLALILDEQQEMSWAWQSWRELQDLAGGGPDRAVAVRTTSRYQVAVAQVRSPLIGGDVTERVAGEGGSQSVLVADVAGHGAAALAAGAMIQGMFLAHEKHVRSPAQIAGLIHDGLLQRWGGAVHAAAWIAHFSPTGLVVSCNAGHPEPLCIPVDGSNLRWLAVGGPMLGVANPAFEQEKVQLLRGDCIVAISDAVLGAANPQGEPFGLPRIEELLVERRREALEKLVGDLCAAALGFAGVRLPADDFTVLGVRFSRED